MQEVSGSIPLSSTTLLEAESVVQDGFRFFVSVTVYLSHACRRVFVRTFRPCALLILSLLYLQMLSKGRVISIWTAPESVTEITL